MGERTHFTPGPWRIATTGNFGNVIEADSGKRSHEFDNGYRTVAMFQACTDLRRHDEEQANALANGHLIAAAPDLFVALKDALRSSRKDFKLGPDGDRQHREAYAEQFAALAKASPHV